MFRKISENHGSGHDGEVSVHKEGRKKKKIE